MQSNRWVSARCASTHPTNSNPVGWVEQSDTHRSDGIVSEYQDKLRVLQPSTIEHQRRFLILIKPN